ncbi:MAG: DNA/RNA non-specific endonuclease [Treponema sp.]|nr:DNA/RNA non-specific endonuclease [Treponema sp.]
MKRFVFFSAIFILLSSLFAENPLLLGNPSKNDDSILLLEKSGYTVCYSDSNLAPLWVAWHLEETDLGDSGRSNSFKPDTALPKNFYHVKASDYQYAAYGFDRGHVCPSADRTASLEANKETFLMTNMLPQAPNLNRQVWMHLETFEREMLSGGNELYIIAGSFGKGGDGERGYFTEIPVRDKNGELTGKSITVPEFCWKIILKLPKGEDDISRITSTTPVLAVFMPNTQKVNNFGDWEQYLVTVDFIEAVTGYDFFSEIPDDIEKVIESVMYSK